MKDIPRFAATLTLVALIAAGSLAWINEITKPKILEQQEKELTQALTYVLPGVQKENIVPIREDGEILYYEGYRDKDRTQFAGYALLVLSQGYSSTIRTLVGVDSTGTILAIKVLFQQETPGLGTRCEEIRTGESVPWWQAQFSDKNALELAVDKDGGSIESITGATITSRAITEGISKHVKLVLDIIKNK